MCAISGWTVSRMADDANETENGENLLMRTPIETSRLDI